ncbi:MAG: hypothetical protein R3C53_03110 [Pirellulaceae bacterium]
MTATIGFLSVRYHAAHGYFGGYLVVNQLARPLEFHCTLPVKPSRAQTVLYGPTINDFVCGEQIGKALIGKAKLKPDLVLCDSAAALAVSAVSDVAIALLHTGLTPPAGSERLEIPSSTIESQKLSMAGHSFGLPAESALGEPELSKVLGKLSANFELTEPFHRVVDALLEAHPIAKAA